MRYTRWPAYAPLLPIFCPMMKFVLLRVLWGPAKAASQGRRPLTYLLLLFLLHAPGLHAADLGPESVKFLDECRYILTPLESKMFKSLDTEEKRHKFIANFWKGLDPNPATDFNEYRQLYYQRMAEANRLFSRGSPGYLSDRGKVYMLLGKPDEKESYYAGRKTDEHPSEIWTYRSAKHLGLDRDTEIAFVDETGTGNYRFSSRTALDAGAARAATVRGLQLGLASLKTIAAVQENPRDAATANAEQGVTSPTATESAATPLAEPPGEFSGVIAARYDFFKAFLGKTLLVMTVALDRGSNKGEAMDYKVFARVERTDLPKEEPPAAAPPPPPATGDEAAPAAMPPPEPTSFDLKDDFEARASKEELLYQALLPLKPGKYKVVYGVTDIPGNTTGSYTEELSVPDYNGDSLTLSSIVPATKIEEVKQDPALDPALDPTPEEKLVPFQLSGSTVVPCVNGRFSPRAELFVYFQGYGAAIDPASGKPKLNVDYLILRKQKSGKWKPIGRMPQPNQTELAHVYDLPLSQLPKGKADYKVTVTVEDKLGGKKAKGETFFSVR